MTGYTGPISFKYFTIISKMNTFCTIINRQYLPFASVLYQSLAKTEPGVQLQVLITDLEHSNQLPSPSPNVIYYSQADILDSPVAKNIYQKYAATNADVLRWALKPVFICHLLQSTFEKVIFVDPDMYFVNRHHFLFDSLNEHAVLLSPHWGSIDPLKNEDGLYSVLRNGLYSGGFVAASRKGIMAMEWWAGVCHYKMDRRPELGLYDDQKYLDIIPLIENTTGIIRHKGCNLASINIDSCKREIVDNKLLIDKEFEPVFIHFTKDTVINIINRNDQLLKPFLDKYIMELRAENFDLPGQLDKIDSATFSSAMYAIKHKARLRTRIKRFFFKLAEKI